MSSVLSYCICSREHETYYSILRHKIYKVIKGDKNMEVLKTVSMGKVALHLVIIVEPCATYHP